MNHHQVDCKNSLNILQQFNPQASPENLSLEHRNFVIHWNGIKTTFFDDRMNNKTTMFGDEEISSCKGS